MNKITCVRIDTIEREKERDRDRKRKRERDPSGSKRESKKELEDFKDDNESSDVNSVSRGFAMNINSEALIFLRHSFKTKYEGRSADSFVFYYNF